jgi:pimeloyl-ACP methyl ester carboxylesterase
VFIHGFGGSGALFFEIMKPLSEVYHAIFIDIIGMGGSTRYPYTFETPEQTADFFMKFLESWRVARDIT